MCQTTISVWFVCRLCRGSFGQVDAFIEHKKQKHFTQFQNTTSIVFEETEPGLVYHVITNSDDHQLADQNIEPPIKTEANDDDSMIPLGSEIIDNPNLCVLELKSEPIAYENKIIPDNENSFFGLEQPEQNPYVLLKRLTTEEIQRGCVLQLHSTLFKYEHNSMESRLHTPKSSDVDININDDNECENGKENQLCAAARNITTKPKNQFDCKLCSKQLESEAQLKIHVGICALYHEDQSRFCVICNRKFCEPKRLKEHHLRFHGTEEEKLSLYKFKCHVCLKQYRQIGHLRGHLETHKKQKQQVRTSNPKLIKCLHPNCGKEFRCNSNLRKHISAVHLGVRSFSCSFSNCNKKFVQSSTMKAHFMIHTGERPYKCIVDNCSKTFMFFTQRSRHHRTAHGNN